MNQRTKTPEIVTGQYFWKGNLNDYVQNCQVKVKLPVARIDGTRLNAKVVIENCLRHKSDKHEIDHMSLRLQSIQECFALFVSLVLAIREYARITPVNTVWVYKELLKRVQAVFRGEYDQLVRK